MNLMEGALRLGTNEYRQLVGIARGSAGEACYQLLLARDLNYISSETYNEHSNALPPFIISVSTSKTPTLIDPTIALFPKSRDHEG